MKLFKKMYFLVLALLMVFTLNNCSSETISTQEELGKNSNDVLERNDDDLENPVIHRVTAGGNDLCAAFGQNQGCDGNYSLVAIQKADGTVMGQWQDTWPGGGNGIHVNINCMYVEGNMAIVAGYVTNGGYDEEDYTGLYVITKVIDNGTSNDDIPDQMTYPYTAPPDFCEYPGWTPPMFDLTTGQVKVW